MAVTSSACPWERPSHVDLRSGREGLGRWKLAGPWLTDWGLFQGPGSSSWSKAGMGSLLADTLSSFAFTAIKLVSDALACARPFPQILSL